LIAHGYEVLCAQDGREAIEVARAHIPSLIVLDIMMPNLDGTEAARILREDVRTKRIPIIYLTALKSREDDPILSSFEQSAVFGKPVDMHAVLAKIDELISYTEQKETQ